MDFSSTGQCVADHETFDFSSQEPVITLAVPTLQMESRQRNYFIEIGRRMVPSQTGIPRTEILLPVNLHR